jgi:DNA-binding PadR family transcriptional regulator
MNEDGLLKVRWAKSKSGPKKKIYELTEEGESVRTEILMDAISTVHNFYLEYLLRLPPELNPFVEICTTLLGPTESNLRIACVVKRFSTPVNHILGIMQRMLQNAEKFIIGPADLVVHSEFEEWQKLSGDCQAIPLKDSFLDVLVLLEYGECHGADSCIKEWRRVLAQGGRLGVVTAKVTAQGNNDPLSIGVFIETQEHRVIMGQGYLDWTEFKSGVNGTFQTVEDEEIADVFVLTAT